jgi:hypothetical protein
LKKKYDTKKQSTKMLAKIHRRIKYLTIFALLIHASNSIRSRTYLHRCALLTSAESLWTKVYHCGDASSFLSLTGLSRQAFLLLFDVLFLDNQQPKKASRPLLMDPTAQLGWYLFLISFILFQELSFY